LVGFILANNKVSIVPLVDCYIENGNLYDPTTHEQIYPTSDTYYYEINEEKVYTPDESYELVDVTSSVLIQPSVNQIVIEIRGNEAFRWNGWSYNQIVDSTKAPDVPTFSAAQTRENIKGDGTEDTATLWGKVKKWFSDLKAVAFSGSYNDLSNKPLSVESSKVKYTLSDGTTKLTLAQESDLKTVAFTGSYNDLTNKPQNATTTTAGLMSADDKYLLVFFKTISITSLSTAIPPNTPIGLIRVSTNIININIRTYGSWNLETMGQLCFGIAGRPQYGYGIAQSGICYTRTSLTLKCGLKNGEVYIWVVFHGTSYNSDCQFFIEGFAASYAQSLDYATLDESEFTNINYLTINAI
jgi:hypothetical protein